VVPVPAGVFAVIVSVLSTVTAVVVTVKVTDFRPAAIVAVDGTVADGSLDVSVTVTEPPVATVPLSVTVAVDEAPPATDAGLSVRELTHGTSIVNANDSVAPFEVTETLALWLVVTGTVLASNVTEVAPAGTVTVAGTVQFTLFEARVKAVPPVGAAVASVIV